MAAKKIENSIRYDILDTGLKIFPAEEGTR